MRIGLTVLNHKHQRTQTDVQYQHKHKIDGDLGETLLERAHQDIALVDETEQLENAEDTDEAERTQQNHVSCVGQEVGEVRRQDRQQVDDAKETQHVVARPGRAVDTGNVLDGKEEGEQVFQYLQHQLEGTGQRRNCLDERDDDAQRDGYNQRDVKDTSERTVRLEHDAIELFFLKPMRFLHTSFLFLSSANVSKLIEITKLLDCFLVRHRIKQWLH